MTSPSLVTLPRELVSLITSHLPLSDLIVLGQTCRSLHPFLTKERLWERLDVAVPPHYGEYPRVCTLVPHEPEADDIDDIEGWMRSHAVEGKASREVEARERVKRLMWRADRADWEAVRELRLQVYPRAALGMAHLLDFVESNITSLIIDVPGMLPKETPWQGIAHRTLCASILDGPLVFQALTTLRLGSGSVFHPSFITHLCNIAPNLPAVDIDISHDRWSEPGPWEPTRAGILDGPTHIQSLRIESDYADDEYTPTLVHVMQSSPRLRQVSLDYKSNNADVLCDQLDGLRGIAALEVLHVALEEVILDHCSDGGYIPEDLALQILITPLQYEMKIFQCRLPSLRQLYSDVSLRRTPWSPPLPPSASTIYPSDMQEMLPIFAENLLRNPKLSLIHTFIPQGPASTNTIDDVRHQQRSDTLIGQIHSWRHGGEEVLYALLYLNSVEAAHTSSWDCPSSDWESGVETYRYTERYGARREKRYISREKGSWQHYSSFKGNVVPFDVIHRMRQAEGMTAGEWGQRGVEVGEKSWQILTAWRAEVKRD